ncbi:hypothetical protein [Candidatus Amarolinea dominans]|uniref:hypothetical protein n=1 Tax=Candidatus Amarolinea dominans TaxID=3140696 RepID=UPI001E15D0CC|nr:hypothetical protein [Anaerolineae bacterium]
MAALLFQELQPDSLAISLDQGADPAAILALAWKARPRRFICGAALLRRPFNIGSGAYGRIRIFENIKRLDPAG